MNARQFKIKPNPLFIAVILLAGFLYAIYFLLGEIDAANNIYIEKTKALLSLEKKQEQIGEIRRELSTTEKNRAAVLSSLLSPENALEFILKIEEIAKNAGLSYEVHILREISKESIDQELFALKRSRRNEEEAREEALAKKLPGIVFNIDIRGSYVGIIRFFEGISSLPYYTHIENFTVSADSKGGEEESGAIKSTVQLTVFTQK